MTTVELTNRQRANRALLATLIAVWDEHPDERLGQLIMNVSRDTTGSFRDTWNWKHGDWSDALTAYYYRRAA